MENGTSVSTTTLVGRKTAKEEISLLRRLLWLANYIYHQALTLLSVLLIWIYIENYDRTTLRFWHVLLSTAAYLPLMAIAIIAFAEDNILTLYFPRKKIYWVHGVLLFISCAFITAGISVETHAKRQRGASHFQSDHAILGLVSWVLIVVSIFIGLLAANTQLFSKYVKPVIAKFIHNFLGIAAFFIGIASLFDKIDVVRWYASEPVYQASYYSIWIISVWSILAALKSLYGQIRNIIF
ncbi:uncharacterized protein LOC115890265 [Sitophilus oryzae]|uniref:ascorbate ferrireductase (transmembrane) n=1 Tax=Sitophilus oryzae TaxID=7048 RepID=A0A6J2YQJ0_SITOR|nr:uncharacterized protein LOC115890265 [Sitophilus oryzae]